LFLAGKNSIEKRFCLEATSLAVYLHYRTFLNKLGGIALRGASPTALLIGGRFYTVLSPAPYQRLERV